MRTKLLSLALGSLTVLASGCGDGPAPLDASNLDAGSTETDGGTTDDAGAVDGGAPTADGGASDSGLATDAGNGAAETCAVVCERLAECVGMPSAIPECIANCEPDLLDCSAAQLTAIEACTAESCDPTDRPAVIVCVMAQTCVDTMGM